MRAERARKSSTSSARPLRRRSRYLGVEVAGEPLRPLSPAEWPARLREALAASGAPSLAFRVVRSDARRAIVRVDGADLAPARGAWTARPSGTVRTVRTWGTLVGAKAWMGRSPPP